jgi:hypothetical protein
VTYKPPKGPPGDRSHLERLVQELSVEEGIAADRLRRWVSTQVLLGALARDDDDEHKFLLKGGVAMELQQDFAVQDVAEAGKLVQALVDGIAAA